MTGYKLAVEYYENEECDPFQDPEKRIGGCVLLNFDSEETEVRKFSKSVLELFMSQPTTKVRDNYSEFYKIWSSGDKYWFRVFPKSDFDFLESDLGSQASMSEILFDKELNALTEVPESSNIFDELLETI